MTKEDEQVVQVILTLSFDANELLTDEAEEELSSSIYDLESKDYFYGDRVLT